ncbi:EAL domain-containing protein [Nitrincola alkalilacustris]|uniref:EAL domain-containing protein n=1 Tax=Nitrincola alkalilacustris TaxID=1571224 RepID=UPI00124BEAE9|nr:EAL domain-containing protein [Nitrincola alkalilacustris]
MRVLYIEDNIADADLARRMLAASHPQISLTLSATLAEGMQQLNGTQVFDLLLTDLSLPDGSGIEALTYVRERQLPMAVVILTGQGDHNATISALKAGADDYIVKRDSYLKRLAQIMLQALTRYRTNAVRSHSLLRVLYAEHNAFDIDLARRHLSQHAPQIRLTAVRDATSVLSLLPVSADEPNSFDLLLLDFRLPGMDGLELARIIRDERKLELPIVLITGQGTEEIASQAINLGIDDYLAKHDGYLYELAALMQKVFRSAELLKERKRLLEVNQRFAHLLSASPTVLYNLRMHDNSIRAVWISENFTEITGYDVSQALQPEWWQQTFFPQGVEHNQALKTLFRQGSCTIEHPLPHADGVSMWLRHEMRLLQENQDELCDIVGTLNDITQQKRTEARLREAAAVFENTSDGVLITDLQAHIQAVNAAFTEITGYSEEEVVGTTPALLKSGRHACDFYQAMWASLLETGAWQGEVWNRRKNGELYPQYLRLNTVYGEQGRATNYIGVFSDISHQKRSEAQLEHLTHYDPLTQLPNRLLLLSRLDHAVEQAQRSGHHVAALYMDLDRFKTINDSFGHSAGDEFLKAIATRIKYHLRKEDTLARLGGDEFMLVMEGVSHPDQAATVAQSILDLLKQPVTLSTGHDVVVGASIGISLYPEDAGNALELVQYADTAMNVAKSRGRDQHCFFTEELTQRARQRLELENALRRALDNEEFVLHYQPMMSIETGKVVGVEALLRWEVSSGEMLPPSQFIPIAEETGLILPLGRWVIQAACLQMSVWINAGYPLQFMSVNLSGKQFQRGELDAEVQQALANAALDGRYLELELTESIIMDYADHSLDTMNALKAAGIHLSIDDFGTGYSSLAHLKNFPIDRLKIDQSFVRSLTKQTRDQAIVYTIINMADNLGLDVVAEGVETAEQLDLLRELGCHICQGYYFSPAQTPRELEQWMMENLS